MKKVYILLVIFSFFSIGLAQNKPFVIDFTQPIVTADGQTIQKTQDRNGPKITLGDISVISLETLTNDEKNISGLEKFKRDELARKIYNNKHAVLSVEELAMIKNRIGEIEPPSIVGAAWRLLDPSTIEK